MGFFTPRERRELNKAADIAEFAPPRRDRSHDLTDANAMRRLTAGPLQEIDRLIAGLHMRRETLLGESVRMQRELAEYAHLNQSTMESTRIIAEALASWPHWLAPPDSPAGRRISLPPRSAP